MGAGCSLHQGRVAPAPVEFPAARRVVFCGLGRSGKTTLIDWVVQWSQTFVAAAAEADGGGTEEDEEAKTEGAAFATTAMPRVPERTVGSRLRALADGLLVLVDTPGMVCDENGGPLATLAPGSMDRAAAIVFVVDATDPIRAILAQDTFASLLAQQLPRTRPGTPVLLLANQKFKSQTPVVDVSAWPQQLQVSPSSVVGETRAMLVDHFVIQSMSFSKAEDVAQLADSLMGVAR
jgi:GTPase SAR1 family protein